MNVGDVLVWVSLLWTCLLVPCRLALCLYTLVPRLTISLQNRLITIGFMPQHSLLAVWVIVTNALRVHWITTSVQSNVIAALTVTCLLQPSVVCAKCVLDTFEKDYQNYFWRLSNIHAGSTALSYRVCNSISRIIRSWLRTDVWHFIHLFLWLFSDSP
jgi:hypothetical protein